MKISKLTAMAALAIAALMALNATAADKPKGEGKERPAGVRPGGGKIAEELGLTAEQKTKFEGIQKDTAEKRKALREDTSLTPEQRREKAKALGEETKTKLKEVLTAEQLAKFEEMQKNRPGRPGGPGGPGGDHKPSDAPAKAK
jgi:Spy/CpxP family protein refolding chaperone